MKEKNDSKLIGMVLSIFTGCTSIQLVSNYDESTDNQTQYLQKNLMLILFLSKMQMKKC